MADRHSIGVKIAENTDKFQETIYRCHRELGNKFYEPVMTQISNIQGDKDLLQTLARSATALELCETLELAIGRITALEKELATRKEFGK
jgi:hypothetical protein